MKYLIAITCFIIFLLPFHSYGQHENSIEGDRQALMNLYDATGGSDWSNNSGWGSGNPDNSWHGVEVDGSGRVVRLDLQDNGLEGQLPESIGNLTQLKYINVKQNYLSGELPSSIGNMKSLTHLFLNGRIKEINTDYAQHPGKAPGGTGANERTNNFTGHLPESIGELTNLQWLELNGTGKVGEGLEGAIPESFGNLKNLKGLHLDHNRLDRLPESLGNLTNLVHLALGHQGRDIDGDYHLLEGHGFPQWIGKLTKLRYLWMGNNEGIGGHLPDMSTLTELEIFLADRNKLTGEIPSYFTDGTMPNINMVGLAWNNFSGTMPEIGEPNNLKMFTIDGNDITGSVPDSWGSDVAGKLINFGLGWNELEGEIPDLSYMSRLRYVRANDNNLTGTVPMVDTDNEKLQFIHLQNNCLSGEIPYQLAQVGKLPKFRELNVSGNQFSEIDLQPIVTSLKGIGKLDIIKY